MGVEYKCCDMEFYKRILIVVLLLMFAGLMSGLTLGLMSLSLVDLEVLAKSGTPQDRNNAGNFSPCLMVMEHHHNVNMSSSLRCLEITSFSHVLTIEL